MADNLIQIVDENDSPTGTATKNEAATQGLWYRAVRVMLIDEAGRILLQKRAGAKKSMPSLWDDSATGHVEGGEDYLAAARRELKEDLGLWAGNIKQIGIFRTTAEYGGATVNRFNGVFSLKVRPDATFTVEHKQQAEVRWFSLQDAWQMIRDHPDQTTLGLREVLNRYYKAP